MAKWNNKEQAFYSYDADFRRIGQIPFVVEITEKEAKEACLTMEEFIRIAIDNEYEVDLEQDFYEYDSEIESFILKHLQNETDVEMQTLNNDGSGVTFAENTDTTEKVHQLWNQNPLFLINGEVVAGTAVGFIKQNDDIKMVLAVSVLDNQDVCIKEYLNGGYLPDEDAEGKCIYDHYKTYSENNNLKYYILTEPMNGIIF